MNGKPLRSLGAAERFLYAVNAFPGEAPVDAETDKEGEKR